MVNKVRVYGKAQNRTALGIMHAYMVMHPEATLADLQKAFPDALNPDSGVKKNFIKVGESTGPSDWNGYFTEPEELLTLGDGTQAAVVKMWTKPSFERVVEHAKQYGIEIAEFVAAEKGIGKKGGFRLEYLNGYEPPMAAAAAPAYVAGNAGGGKKMPSWLWWVLGLAALAALASIYWCNPRIVEKTVIQNDTIVQNDTITIRDTVYIQQVEELEKEFNAAKFAQNKTDLTDDAKEVLFKLADVLKKHEEINLKVVGHTSIEGSPTHNQKLSEERAKAAVDFLVSRGVPAERLSYEGKGSSEPIDPNNNEINRRTEFIVFDKPDVAQEEEKSEN